MDLPPSGDSSYPEFRLKAGTTNLVKVVESKTDSTRVLLLHQLLLLRLTGRGTVACRLIVKRVYGIDNDLAKIGGCGFGGVDNLLPRC